MEDSEFSYPRQNLIVSNAGFTVEVKLPRGIRYAEADRSMEIFAEALTTAEPKIIVRRHDIRLWESASGAVEATSADRERILANLERAFAYRDWVLIAE